MEGKTFGVLFVIVALNCERSEMRRLLNQITFTRSWTSLETAIDLECTEKIPT
jgi:hypothetical protein